MALCEPCDNCGESFPTESLMLMEHVNRSWCHVCVKEFIDSLYELHEIYDLIVSQKFYNWYCKGGTFDRHITGDRLPHETESPSFSQVLEDLRKML